MIRILANGIRSDYFRATEFNILIFSWEGFLELYKNYNLFAGNDSDHFVNDILLNKDFFGNKTQEEANLKIEMHYNDLLSKLTTSNINWNNLPLQKKTSNYILEFILKNNDKVIIKEFPSSTGPYLFYPKLD